MKVVYVAGPYRAANAWEVEQNIRRAEAVALEVWRLGAVAVCPHAMTRYYEGVLPDDMWLSGGLELLRRCDAVALVDGWERSSGTAAEVAEAKACGLPVFTRMEVEEWLWRCGYTTRLHPTRARPGPDSRSAAEPRSALGPVSSLDPGRVAGATSERGASVEACRALNGGGR